MQNLINLLEEIMLCYNKNSEIITDTFKVLQMYIYFQMTRTKTPLAIGIDLGTTHSCVAVFHNGKVDIIPNDHGSRCTPSCVAFTGVERLIGNPAKQQANLNPSNTIFGAKRLIGRRSNDPAMKIDMNQWLFKVEQVNWRPKIKVQYLGEERILAPEELSAMVLNKMKLAAEDFLGKTVSEAVITVPASFNDSQRQATIDAAAIAGLNVLRVINDPTAAALDYGLDKGQRGEKHVLIFDLGGGTFDASILRMEEGSMFEVLATAGNARLGGQDFDHRLLNHLVHDIKRKHHKDLSTCPTALQRLLTACERAKKTLSNSKEAVIELDVLFDSCDYHHRVSRARFEELCGDLFSTTIQLVDTALREAKLDKGKIDEIVMVGGSTRIPKVQNLLSDFFNGKELNKSMNPEEALACGAAIQAAILTGDTSHVVQGVLAVDRASHSVGVEAAGGVMAPLVKRGNILPTKTSKTFTTFLDNQHSLEIKVFEGERSVGRDNNILGMLQLTGIPRAVRGVPRIEVTFVIDANGILDATALDKSTGIPENIGVKTDKRRLSLAEIDQLMADAEKFKDNDEKQRKRLAARKHLEIYVGHMRQALEEAGNKKTFAEKRTLLHACNDTMSWLQKNQFADEDELDYRLRKLQHLSSTFLTALNQQGQGQDDQPRQGQSGHQGQGRDDQPRQGQSDNQRQGQDNQPRQGQSDNQSQGQDDQPRQGQSDNQGQDDQPRQGQSDHQGQGQDDPTEVQGGEVIIELPEQDVT